MGSDVWGRGQWGVPVFSSNLRNKGGCTEFGQIGVFIGLLFFQLDPRIDKIGQMGKIWGLSLGCS